MKQIPDGVYQKFVLRVKPIFEVIKKHKKIVVATSGGPDSMFLLFLLHKLSLKHNLEVLAVYINHNLRTKNEILKDIKTIESFCKTNNLKLIVDEIKPQKFDENTLRELRYKKLLNIAYKNKCFVIATAHTQTDLAETFILNLLRGSGLRGLCGVPPIRTIKYKKENIYIIRPLIDITKQEIIRILNKNKISYVIDKTNLQDLYKRNFLRNKIFPLFKRINENCESNIAYTSLLINKVYESISSSIEKKIKNCVVFRKSSVYIDLKKFLMYNDFTQREILYRIISKLALEYDLEIKQGYRNFVEQILSLVNKKLVKLNFTKNIKILTTYRYIKININA
ncbi:MAG: tRNA lysidine(34) synthetase TilS [Endomicrobiia bacterium]